jgi:hypothetical protein
MALSIDLAKQDRSHKTEGAEDGQRDDHHQLDEREAGLLTSNGSHVLHEDVPSGLIC